MRVSNIISGATLELKCSHEELNKIVEEYIEGLDLFFSYTLLYSNIIHIAEDRDLFIKEQNTEYSNIKLGDKILSNLNMIINDLLFNRKIIIDFNSSNKSRNNEIFS